MKSESESESEPRSDSGSADERRLDLERSSDFVFTDALVTILDLTEELAVMIKLWFGTGDKCQCIYALGRRSIPHSILIVTGRTYSIVILLSQRTRRYMFKGPKILYAKQVHLSGLS